MNRANASAASEQTASAVLAELADGLVSRVQAGEPIDWQAVAREHPEHAAELRRLVEALGVLDALPRSVEAGESAGLGVPARPDAASRMIAVPSGTAWDEPPRPCDRFRDGVR